MKKVLVYSAALLFFLTLCKEGMMPIPTLENAIYQSGWVEEVREGSGKGDIVIALKGDPAYYYINRGLDQGLSLQQLKAKFEDRKVTLSYVDDWSILDPWNQTRHISSIKIGQEQVYSEFTP